MANEPIVLNNYSDDSQIKLFMNTELAGRVFHDIPINVLNTGMFSLNSEYISQITEQLAFTSSFYFNESFITKAVLPDSIYAEAAIFNIGYSFATPASSNFLLELRIADIRDNAVYNADNGLNEFILDKNTKFNLPEGYVYSLDYDILIQYKNDPTSSANTDIPAWNVQYINKDEANMCATNKGTYLTYRVTETWLCILVQANEYERETHTVVNNMSNDVPNADTVITCNNHIAGFDIKYIDTNGNETWLKRDHILTIHDNVKDLDPYVNYIMDNPQTIRFMWQLAGNKYFVPESNSSFEITIYTCHGKSANAPDYTNEQQPQVISSANKYSNNANVTKAVFVISGCVGGTDIGTVESVRRDTIEAYNTANVISTDHDIDEWFKTFYFKGLLYPYFFKRRDDPWGRIWSGYMALHSDDDHVFKTNTLHALISYKELYDNNNNTVSSNGNEIIIPPGWLWTYVVDTTNRCTVTPYTKVDGVTIENAKTLATITDKFVFANPFGIRIQKDPFAIGYFNPWINEYYTSSRIDNNSIITDNVYHASPEITNISRIYKDDFYHFTTLINPNSTTIQRNSTEPQQALITKLKMNALTPNFIDSMWNYFKKPIDQYAEEIPLLPLSSRDGYVPFDPDKTYLCCDSKIKSSDGKTWRLKNLRIIDQTNADEIITYLSITGTEGMYTYGSDALWGDNAEGVEYSGDTNINIYPALTPDEPVAFSRIPNKNYYEMRLSDTAEQGSISKIIVTEAIETELTKYGESYLVRIGKSYADTVINVYFVTRDEYDNPIETQVVYTIKNAANVYMPYEFTYNDEDDTYVFDMNNVGATGIVLYADMKPSANTGSYEYYRVPFSDVFDTSTPLFYVHSSQLPLDQNNLRVILSSTVNGSVSGYVEMEPVKIGSNGSYVFEVDMYPLTELIDIDNRIEVASIESGGNWIGVNGSNVTVDVDNPQFKISILYRDLNNPNGASPISDDERYVGYMITDEYVLDNVSLIQELKEMRSVVDFGDSSTPTEDQISLYYRMFMFDSVDPNNPDNLKFLTDYTYNRKHDIIDMNNAHSEFLHFLSASANCLTYMQAFKIEYEEFVDREVPAWMTGLIEVLQDLADYTPTPTDIGEDFPWSELYDTFSMYPSEVSEAFKDLNVDGGVTIQLVPFVARDLIMSDDFRNFVSSFTQIHKAIEPVIFKRLEGNNYLDCKLIATYGKPHSYSSDIDATDPNRFWPDLDIQIEFDVKINNQSLAENTINDLKLIIRSYFNRITTVHTPTQDLSMENNIYISNLIQQMEEHSNVLWLKFKGWYTNEKGNPNGNYMDSTIQAIVQKWKKLEDMPTDELERYVPEMFLLEPNNIVINIIK